MAMKQLHPGAKWLFRVNGFFGSLFFVFFFAMFFGGLFVSLAAKDGVFNFMPLISYALAVVVILLIFMEIYARLSYRFFKYEFTSDQLRVERGIIWKRYSNIPYQRIQNVDITRGVIARICGFSSVNVQTAGYSVPVNGRGMQSEGYLPAVSVKEAEQIREFLIKKISKNNKSGL